MICNSVGLLILRGGRGARQITTGRIYTLRTVTLYHHAHLIFRDDCRYDEVVLHFKFFIKNIHGRRTKLNFFTQYSTAIMSLQFQLKSLGPPYFILPCSWNFPTSLQSSAL